MSMAPQATWIPISLTLCCVLDKVCWPRDLLKNDIRNARIITWGYDSSVLNATKAASQASIFSHAENLLGDVARSRQTDAEVGLIQNKSR